MPEFTPEQIKEELTAIAARLFDEGKVDCFLAYERGTVPFKTTPLIARKKEDLQRVWVEDYFAPNLSVYLKEIRGRIGILVKGCDSRSLVSLLKEDQIKREDFHVVGISCPGQIDLRKLAQAAACEPEELEEIVRKGSEVLVRAKGQEKTLPKPQALLDKCLRCRYPKPLIFDTLLPGEYVAPVDLEDPGGTDPATSLKDELGGNPSRRSGPSGPSSSSVVSVVMPAGMSARPASVPGALWKRTCPSGSPPCQPGEIILSFTSCASCT